MSKQIYIAGESRMVDAVNIPKDKDKTGYERFVPEGTVPDGYVPEGTVPDGYVPEGTLPDGAVIPDVVVTDTEAVAPKAFASGTYLQNGMTVSAPGVEPPTYDTPTVTVSIGLSADEASVKADASAVANGKTGTGSATKALSAMGLVKPAVTVTTKKTYNAGDEIAAGTYLKLGAEVAAATSALPEWIESMCVQTFTPSADTNEAVTFALTGMSGVPDTVIIGSTLKTPTATRDFGGYVVTKNPFGFAKQSSAGWGGVGFIKLTSAGYSHGGISTPITNESASSMTVITPTYSNTTCYWRAGVTYTVIALRLKALT